MKKIIICEKPSLAKNMRDGIPESFESHDGYYESAHYVICYVFGHLFELKSIEQYRADYDHTKKYPWTLENLPYYPKEFQFTIKDDSGIKKQYKIIKSLLERADVDTVYHLGDADREGEVLIRIVLQEAKNTKPVLRIWTDDQMPESLYEALKKAKPDSEYNSLAAEGYARMYIDWLYGINLSRLVSLKAGTLERVGRCIMAIVREIYNREMEIKFFVPRLYYAVESATEIKGIKLTLKSKQEFDRDLREKALELANTYNQSKTVVKKVMKQDRELHPSKPFSQTSLQSIMGKKYKISPDRVLAAAQKLYENGIISYPRTNSNYYADGEKEKIANILSVLKEQGFKVSIESGKKFFDNAKVESHGALRITKIVDQSSLSDTEAKVYDTILGRMLADFCEEKCIITETYLFFDVGGYEEMKASGKIVKEAGFFQYEPSFDLKDKIVPDLKEGEIVETNFKPVEKETQPPKRYTIETLNNYCENPFRSDMKDEDEDFKAIVSGLAIGTGATRAGLYKNAIDNGYISLKKETYYLEENGKFCIEMLDKLHINMDKYKTAEIGQVLKDVLNNRKTLEQAIVFAEEQITIYFNGACDVVVEKAQSSQREEIGKCPKCGSPVYEARANFYCSNHACNFSLFKENKWFTMKKKTITKTIAKNLLRNGKAKVTGLYSSQKDKLYDATVVMTVGEQYPSFSLEFDSKKAK